MELTDDMLETNLAVASHYLSLIPLMSSTEKLKLRKVHSVLIYFTPNKNRNYKVYAHHLLILFYPLRTKSDLKSDNSYTKKVATPDVIDIVNKNRSIIEPYCELVDEDFLRYNTEVTNNDDIIEENSFLTDVLYDDNIENKDVSSMYESGITDFEITSPLLLQNGEEISESIRSVNVKQRKVFDHV